MMSRFAKKTHLKSLVSILVFGGMLISYAGAEELFKATRYNRDGEVKQDWIDAKNNRVIRIQSLVQNHDFGVVFGVRDGSDPALKGRGRVVVLEDQDYEQQPAWEVERGIAVARGWRPRIRGSTATAAAEGSTIIFERDSTYEWVFFPMQKNTSAEVFVWVGSNSTDRVLIVPGQYVQVKNGQEGLNSDDIKSIEGSAFELRVRNTLNLAAVQELPEIKEPDQSSASRVECLAGTGIK